MAFTEEIASALEPRERAVWERITYGRRIHPNDLDDYKALCFWYVVAEDCRSMLTDADGRKRVVTADEKQAPAMVALMNAENQIRQLRVLLGIDARTQLPKEAEEQGTPLDEVRKRREARKSRAKD